MGINDQYYRGLVAYTNATISEKDITKLNNVVKQTNLEEDVLETKRLVCTIDEDWVKNIEEGLVYVEKAVREERQFIRTEGEVVPIERAKHTSKTTVEHLARHSNFITHLPEKEGDDLVPDKLYIVEKESDYAVYENRFLYMMLTYLRDFIAIRLSKIRDMMTTYRARFAINKKIDLARRQINVKIDLSDQIKDDPILLEKYSAIKIIDRIEMQYHLVLALLATPLMEQVSKAPMIKPPITKTNTLKMNTNFKTSLALYDYISAYSTDGYSFEEEIVKLNPFNDETAEDYAKVVALNAFMTYKNSNGLSKELKNNYLEYEKELKEQEKLQRIEQLKRLKRHINESGKTMEEYLTILEAQNRSLEKELSTLDSAKKTIEELKLSLKEIEKEKAELEKDCTSLKEELDSKSALIEELKEASARNLYVLDLEHKKDIEKLKASHLKAIEDLNKKHDAEIVSLKDAQLKEIQEIEAKHEAHIEEINNEHELDKENAINVATKSLQDELSKVGDKHRREVDSLNGDITKYKEQSKDKDGKINQLADDKKRLISDYEDKIYNLIKKHREDEADLNKEIKLRQGEIDDLNEEIDHLIKERQFVEAQLHAIRLEQGKTTDEYDYTSKERFEELEAQYKAFKQLFVKEWGKTKKRIRKEMFEKTDEELKAMDEAEKASNPEEKPKPVKKSKAKVEKTDEELKAMDEAEKASNPEEKPKPVKKSKAKAEKIEEKKDEVEDVSNTEDNNVENKEIENAEEESLKEE